MMNSNDEVASGAVAKALARASRCAAVAAVATVLYPLASLPAMADLSVKAETGTFDGQYYIQYAMTNHRPECGSSGERPSSCYNSAIDDIVIPEYHLLDLQFNASGGSLPSGWSAQEYTPAEASGFTSASLASGDSPGGYIDLFYNSDSDSSGGPIYANQTLYFTALIPTLKLADANFDYIDETQFTLVQFQRVDPPVPDTRTPTTAVPEPSVLASLGIGLTAFFGARRRKRQSA